MLRNRWVHSVSLVSYFGELPNTVWSAGHEHTNTGSSSGPCGRLCEDLDPFVRLAPSGGLAGLAGSSRRYRDNLRSETWPTAACCHRPVSWSRPSWCQCREFGSRSSAAPDRWARSRRWCPFFERPGWPPSPDWLALSEWHLARCRSAVCSCVEWRMMKEEWQRLMDRNEWIKQIESIWFEEISWRLAYSFDGTFPLANSLGRWWRWLLRNTLNSSGQFWFRKRENTHN